jgi:hypothetical protein
VAIYDTFLNITSTEGYAGADPEFQVRGVSIFHQHLHMEYISGADPVGKKIRFFGAKSWFFTRNTPKNFLSAPP